MADEKVVSMTPELQAALDACKPIDIERKTFEYVPEAYRLAYPDDKSKWPVFVLKELDGLQLSLAQDRMRTRLVGSEGVSITMQKGALIAHVCYELGGIVGWRNYEIEYKDRESIRRLQYPLLNELANALTEKRHLTEEELRGLR